MKRSLIISLVLVLTALLPASVLAAAQVTLETTVEKMEVVETGVVREIRFVPTDSGAPGEILRFTLTFTNAGNEIASNVVINNPIPENANYLPESATPFEGVTALFSTDDGDNFEVPASLTYVTTNPDGSTKTVVAPPRHYTHIRWVLPPLAAGASGKVSFEVEIK